MMDIWICTIRRLKGSALSGFFSGKKCIHSVNAYPGSRIHPRHRAPTQVRGGDILGHGHFDERDRSNLKLGDFSMSSNTKNFTQ